MYKRFIFWRDGLNERVLDDRIVGEDKTWENELESLTRCGWTGVELVETVIKKDFNGEFCCPKGYENFPRP